MDDSHHGGRLLPHYQLKIKYLLQATQAKPASFSNEVVGDIPCCSAQPFFAWVQIGGFDPGVWITKHYSGLSVSQSTNEGSKA